MNISNLARKELLQMRWIIIVGMLFAVALAIVIVVTFHYMEQVVAEIPADLMEFLAQYEITRELLFIFGDYTDYVWSQWNAKNLIQAGAILAIAMSASQFAGEVSRRTIGFYLTRPVTRVEGYLAKIAAGVIVLTLVFGSAMIFIWAASSLFGLTAEWGRLVGASLVGLVWLITYYLAGCIISIFNREPITAGVIIGVTGIFISVPGLFAVSRKFSVFYQMRAVDYYFYQQSLAPSILYGIAVSAVLLFAGIRLFKARDY